MVAEKTDEGKRKPPPSCKMGEGMTGMLAVGVLLIALGVVFLAVPLEQLQKVFRRMRSRIGTKIGGAVLVAAGIALALY